MNFFTLHGSVFLFVQKADRGERPLRLNKVNVGQIRGIPQRDFLPGKPVIHLILHMIDHDDTIRGNTALDLQQKRLVDPLLRQAANLFGFREKPLFRRFLIQRGMRPLIVRPYIRKQTAPQLLQRMEVTHIQ